MAKQKLTVELGVDNSKFKKGLNDANKQVRAFGAQLKGIAASAGILVGIQQLFRFGAEAVKIAAKVEGIKYAFDRLNSPDLLKNLQKATRNTVADVDLMSAAVRANNFHISLEALPKYFEFAQQRARATGESVDYLVESIVLGIGRKSAMILDNLGISLADINAELKITPDYATAVGNIMNREMAKGGNAAETAADQIAQMGAAWKNMAAEMGKALEQGLKLGNAFQSIADVLKGLTELKKELDLGGANKDLANLVRGNVAAATGSQAGFLFSKLFGGRKLGKNEILIESADPIVKVVKAQTAAIEEAEEAAKDYNEELRKLMVSIGSTNPVVGAYQQPGMVERFGLDPMALRENKGAYTNGDPYLEGLNDQMRDQMAIAQELTGVFTSMFSVMDQGWKAMADALIDSIKRIAAEILAKAAVWAIMAIIFPGSAIASAGLGAFLGFSGGGGGMSASNVAGQAGGMGSMSLNVVGRLSGSDILLSGARAGGQLNSGT